MKHVFRSSSEVAHVWAQQRQDHGRNPTNNIFFNGSKIWSYGSHFCIARILPGKDGSTPVVVMTTRDYSPTTSGHKSDVRSATRHMPHVYCYDPDSSAGYNKDRVERDLKYLMEEATTARRILPTTRITKRLSALHRAEQFNEYLAALPKNEQTCKPFNLAEYAVSEEDRAILRNYESELEGRRQARHEKDKEKRALIMEKARLDLATKIAEWRAHVYNHTLYNAPTTMLRLSKDGQEIETSRGAVIPVSHAKRLWPLIENVRAVGEPLTGRDFRLGHYTLNTIQADGSIIVGCHDIPYAEIEAIAKALGLLEETEA
jgi:hypothetical protein